MQIASDQVAHVFKPKENKKLKNVWTSNVSTYEGKDKEGKHKYSNWICNYVGDAYEKAKELKDKDVIILSNAKVERYYNKDRGQAFDNITCFDFELDKKEKGENKKEEKKTDKKKPKNSK